MTDIIFHKHFHCSFVNFFYYGHTFFVNYSMLTFRSGHKPSSDSRFLYRLRSHQLHEYHPLAHKFMWIVFMNPTFR